MHLDQPLLALTEVGDYFTLRQACEGVQIFGGIGSGKTSGSGAALAHAYLSAGFGGLVLCAKPEERRLWEKYAAQAGRSQDLIIFDASGQNAFNFLRYEMVRGGRGAGYSSNVVRLFTNIVEAVQGQKVGQGESQYWVMAMQQMVRNAVDLIISAGKELSLPLIYSVIQGGARSIEQRNSREWQNDSITSQLIDTAIERESERSVWMQHDLDAAAIYWMQEFPQMDERPRSGIVSTFTTMADYFMRRPFRQLFCDDKSNIAPDYCSDGSIIIMDLPVKEFAEAGRAAQVMFKFMWQQAMERRNFEAKPNPVFLWADEAQNFVSEYDMQFQATARSSGCCTVYITQNLPNYYAEMGSQAKARTDSMVGNFATKIWHANSDPETNKHAAETIGRNWQMSQSFAKNMGSGGGDPASGRLSGDMGYSTTNSMVFEYEVPPREFTTLSKGGPDNSNIVEAYIFQNGREFLKSKKTFMRMGFLQS